MGSEFWIQSFGFRVHESLNLLSRISRPSGLRSKLQGSGLRVVVTGVWFMEPTCCLPSGRLLPQRLDGFKGDGRCVKASGCSFEVQL